RRLRVDRDGSRRGAGALARRRSRARDLFTHRTQGTWLPVGRDGLEEGGSFHVETGHALDVRALERPSADRVTFALGLPGWNVETRCSIALSARAGGTLLEIEHAGMADVPGEESARTRLRAAVLPRERLVCEQLLAAVRAAAAGLRVNANDDFGSGIEHVHLDPRRREVLRLLAEGADTAAISETLSYSVRTIKSLIYDIERE